MESTAQFIKATEEYNTFENHVPAPYIRRSFFCDKKTDGKIRIAVCGFYKLYLNGRNITKGFLAPYISNPEDIVYYDEYDVSLDFGENVIGLILGNGFQNNPGGYIWDFDKASFRSAPMAALSLSYKNVNGECIVIQSDNSFKTMPSAVRSDDYRFGEVYDANFEISGWNAKNFDDSSWKSVITVPAPDGELRRCTAEPIVKETELKPINIFREDDGYIYDFGVSNAGVCRLCVSGKRGQRIELQHTDLLKDGKFYLDNIWFVNELWQRDKEIVHKDVYICKGGAEESYTPSFTYHGFRYVKVTGITPEQATEDLLTFVVLHSDLKTRGGFSCSDGTVNKLQEITRRSDLSNFYYFPTDCPQREKNGWTADAALSCEQMMLNFNPETSYREWLRNICKAQDKNGALPGIIPTGGWGFKWGNGPAWDCILAYLPYYVYVYRGEDEMIYESADALVSYLVYIASRADEKGLMHIGLGDWCHVGRKKPKAPLELTDTVMSMDIAEKAAFMFDAVGMTSKRDFAKSIADDFKAAIRRNLIDFDTFTAAGNCQTGQAMCLYYNVFTPDEENAAFEVLLGQIHAADDHIDVGVLGGRVIFHVLSRFGHSDLALKMITRPDFPSYGNWLERGATTLWENFRPDFVSSPNHHFWGDISGWFIKALAGIHFNPDGNDIKKVNIRPAFVTALDNARGYYVSPLGKISSSWRRQGDDIELSLEIPKCTEATVTLEQGFCFEDGRRLKILHSGEYTVTIKEKK